MNATKRQDNCLKLYPIHYDQGVMQCACKAGKSWRNKTEKLSQFIDKTKERKLTTTDHEKLERLEIVLSNLEAAHMVCSDHFQFERVDEQNADHAQDNEKERRSNEMLHRICADNLAWRPIAFCRVFWLMQHESGQTRADLRPPLTEIELALRHKSKPFSVIYKMAKAFHFMLMYAAATDGTSDTKSIWDEGLFKMIHEGMLPRFGEVSPYSGSERDAQIKVLRKDLHAAFDLAARNYKRVIHAAAQTIQWADEKGEVTDVLPAWAAIQYTKQYLGEFRAIPTKAEVRAKMEEDHSSLKKTKDSYWSKVWIEAGLSDLPESQPWQASQKTGDFSEAHSN